MKKNITQWIYSLVEPLIGRILTALGIGLVSVVGLEFTLNLIKNQLLGSVNSLPANLFNLFLLGGGGQALGIIFGAITTKMLMVQAANSVKFMSSNPQ